MERRTFVLSAGALAAGGGLALGTGAFSSVEAERDVTVTVASDASGYLGIKPGDGPNGKYADTTGSDALAIDLTGDNDNIGNGIAGGEGVNTNAITAMADVFQIQNQGTQEVDVAVTPLAFGDVEGQVFPPNVDGVLGVLLIPENPDRIDVDIEWNVIWPGIPVPEDVSFIGIKGLDPGDSFEFNLMAIALPSSAVGSTSISDELYITAEVP